MKLSYTVLEQTFSTADTDRLEEDLVAGAVKVLAQGFGVAEKSILYLLQNGWSQSLQDSFAGPRAKAIKDGEDEDSVNEVILGAVKKRVDSIRDGLLTAGSGHGRDPIRSVGLQMLQDHLARKGKAVPKDKTKRAEMLDAWINQKRPEIEAEIARRRKAKLEEADIDDLDFSDL